MTVYLLMIISCFLGSILENTKRMNKKIIKFFQKIYICFFFILIAFNRGNSDYKNYISIFDGTYGVVKEKGYVFFNGIIKYFGGTYNYVPLIMGLLMIYVIFIIYNVKKRITLIFLYSVHNFIFDIIQVRNTFCIFFILIGLVFLKEKKKIKYLIFNVLATSFHTVGCVYFLFYLLSRIKITKYIFALFLSFIVNTLFLDKYVLLAKNLFPSKSYYIKINFNYGVLVFFLLFFIDIFLISYIENTKIKYYSRERDLYIKFILFPIFFLPFGSFHGELIQRLWRNTFILKIIYCLMFSGKKKNKVIIILFLQQLIYLGIRLWRDPNFILGLLKQFNNIDFYF